jgi:hypothetical protein
MSWCNSHKYNSEEEIRACIIDKISSKGAFWILPDKGDIIWSYAEDNNSQKVFLRNIDLPQAEIIFSDNHNLNLKALRSLTMCPEIIDLTKGSNLWSAQKVPSPYSSSPSVLGIFEPNARERLEYKKNNCLLNGVLIKSSSEILAKPHSGFPKPMQGFNIDI